VADTIFPTHSLDREVIHWEDYICTPTPVERRGDLWFKREDSFAPLGYGGVNGGKVRQIIYLTQDYLRGLPLDAKPGLLLAGSVKSPQLGRVPAVAAHFGLPTLLVIGSKLETASRHENVQIGMNLGAAFYSTKVAYNPALQSAARKLHATPEYKDYYLLEYGLSVEGSPTRIEQFYKFCSAQVANLPPEMETLVVPAGSCNTTIAVLYGIARFRPPRLKRIVLFGIGPERVSWFEERLLLIGREAGIDIAGLFKRNYHHHADLARKYGDREAPYSLEHYDLHETKFASYQDEMPATIEGIVLHPTYEGKIIHYVRQNRLDVLDGGRTVFWIVGSTPRWEPMRRNAGRATWLK
jgi:hypothetical protein